MNSSTFRTHSLGLLVLALAAGHAAAQSLLPTQGQVVAQEGSTAAGLGSDVFGTTSPFDTPVIDRNGAILFRGRMAPSGTVTQNLNDRGLFFGRTAADLALVVQSNQLEPTGTYPNSRLLQVSSGSGLPLGSNLFSSQRISPVGNIILFHSQLYDGGNPGLDNLVHTAAVGTVNDSVLFWGPPGALAILAQQNTTTMLGGAKLNFTSGNFSQQSTALNSAGTAIFKSNLEGGDAVALTNDTAWVIGTPSNLSYFVRENDLFLGGTVGIGDNGLGSNCVLNENGQVLHDETLSLTLGSSPATTANDKVVILSTPTGPGTWNHNFIMREGDFAPDATGAPTAATYSGSPTLAQGFTNSGKAAFQSAMAGGPAASGMFVYDGASTKLAAQTGDAVPGGVTINVMNTSTSFSEAGLLIGCTLTGASGATDDSALILANPGQPHVLIAREGDAVPGFPGFTIGNATGSSNFGSSSAHKMNERGHVTFNLACYNVGTSTAISSVTFSWDPVLGLQTQAATGDVIGALTLTSASTPLQFPGGDGSTLGFNNSGDWVARFSGTASASSNSIIRGHVGQLQGSPSAVPVGGGVHNFSLDVTSTYAGGPNTYFFILATALGTGPGFLSPFGPQTVPLNPDPLWTILSLNNPNSIVWVGTLGQMNANGQNVLPASFVMPPGFPVFQGTTLHHAAVIVDITVGVVTTHVTEPVPCYLY